ncbi:tryptophan--tRNA ligase [Saccharicrinis fermentans]|uniref:Tryptophan--tRNA ligase n=1 Tax=Saccharicrinis fermentans DSM 9555 = JCM 21142 TaxID=869213 RepID=W7YKE7_9BACT|nr:tryptophan--tRNA ligase [Saccharicrinis fermentans]GAF02829.1 tryptophan-tRNA ligase [Saccharicrinis fermentans DSM 9555 = JCM 21142]
MQTVVSGIRPTGNLHLGNYFGAVKNFLRMQEEYNCYFFIADYHSLTTHPTPSDLHVNVKQVLAEYLACGLDPEKATIYIQSDVPAIAEMSLLMSMNAYLGELERTTSFKDKARKQPENVNAGLLTYPVLMACDILIHHADKVPVGKDQEQNLEMTRKFAGRFNHLYKQEYFKIPQSFNYGEALVKIPGLDGSGKMGKSEGNGIYLVDDPKTLQKKVMKAVTDSGPTEPNAPLTEPIQNLFTLMEVVSTPDTLQFFKDKYASCEIRYGDLKKQLAEDIIKFNTPIREKIEDIKNNDVYLNKVVTMGREKAQANAEKTVKEIREIIGIKRF